jgi:predicted nucleic-acid-binding protein
MDIKVDIAELTMDTIVGETRIYGEGFDEYETAPQTLGEAVVEQVVRTLIPQETRGELARVVREIRAEVIRDALKPIVAEAIEQGIQRTNTFGEPTGKAITLRELIIAEVKKVMTEPTDRYNRDKGGFVAQLVRAEVQGAIAKEMAAAMANEKAKAVAAVRAKGAEIIAQVVTEGLRKF